jgi:hypothetical protein
MTPADIFLFPIYVGIFLLLVHLRARRYTDPLLRSYLYRGFWLKITGCIAFILFNYYLSIGDSLLLYYNEGINLARLMIKDPANFRLLFTPGVDFDEQLLDNYLNRGYFANEGNYFIAKLVCVFSFFCFQSYSVINLFFAMIAFGGIWRLFRFFYALYPELHRKLAIATLYLPTFLFWTSGILKDPICAGMMGFLSFALYRLIIDNKSAAVQLAIAVASAAIIWMVKPYILIAYLPLLLLFLLLRRLTMLQRPIYRIALTTSLLLGMLLAYLLLADKLQEQMGSLALDKITESVKTTQSNFMNMADLAESSFSLGVTFDGSVSSLVKMFPAAVNATLFRPYLWESKKLSTLLSSLESLALMMLTLYVLLRCGPMGFLRALFSDSAIFFCFVFAIVFAFFVGSTTLNFGTLVRYKVPCMPFYIIALVLMLEYRKKRIAARQIRNAEAENCD